MSQVFTRSALPDGTPVDVCAGWDAPFGRYHITVSSRTPERKTDTVLLDDLSLPSCRTSIDPFKEAVTRLGISVPDGFWEWAMKREAELFVKWSERHNRWVVRR